jgi:glycosyltransferase involved in cell wall biosynthesis
MHPTDTRGPTTVQRRVAVAWWGLPMYAARLIGAAARAAPPGARLDVLATDRGSTRPEAEETAGGRVRWLEQNGTSGWADLGLEFPDTLFVGGWAVPQLRRLAAQAKRQKARLVMLCDNRFTGSLRQRASMLRNRVRGVAATYDSVWVPGESGRRYARRLGFRGPQIETGLYCGDETVFSSRRPLRDRARRFIFVGQFIDRKNVRMLHQAFTRYSALYPADGAEMHMYGSGPLAESLPSGPGLFVHGPAAPQQLASAINDCRCLVLPSLNDNWPLVVHEATLSGCKLLLSDAVGSIPELARPANSLIVSPHDIDGFADAFHSIATMNERQLDEAERISLALAGGYSLSRWAEHFWKLAGASVGSDPSYESA